MIHTGICDLLGIRHPIVLGGMGTATTAPLVAAVSNAGGFGTLGTSAFNATTLETEIASIRERTDKTFGVNHLLFQIQEDMFAVTLRARPTVARLCMGEKRPKPARLFSARPRCPVAPSCTWPGKFPKRCALRKPAPTFLSPRAPKPAAMSGGWRRSRCCR
jgi:NAD(P)H-dependent flavin oxidoreductase YrpB (nitropropane dioxygenase family)